MTSATSAPTLAAHLATLDADRLGAILDRRPGVLRSARPRTLAQLAEQLSAPHSLVEALRDGPLPAVQVAEALAALGPGCSRGAVVTLLGADVADVDRWLDFLADEAIVWPGARYGVELDSPADATGRSGVGGRADAVGPGRRGESAGVGPGRAGDHAGLEADPGGRGDARSSGAAHAGDARDAGDAGDAESESAGRRAPGRPTPAAADRWDALDDGIEFSEHLTEVFGSPLGLDGPLTGFLVQEPAARLQSMLRALGVSKPPTRRADVIVAITEILRDPARVCDIVATAPEPVIAALFAWADESGGDAEDPFGDDFTDYRAVESALRDRIAAARWGAERGIVFGHGYSYSWRMPAEVALALRGPDFHAPFDPVRPVVRASPRSADATAARASAAVTQFADLVLALLDRMARTGIPALKAGGVGARELTKLGKALRAEEPDLRLALAVVGAVGLVETDGRQWRAAAAATKWREQEPADRILPLIIAWEMLPFLATKARDEDDKPVPALVFRHCDECMRGRRNVLGLLAEIGAGAGVDAAALGALALWTDPFTHPAFLDDGGAAGAMGWHLAEAAQLGVVADAALTDIGAALTAGDLPRLRDVLAASLPASNDNAVIGADLTAVVAGTPAARVSRLLDAAADRESRGGATVWRFTPGSIRRALDDGVTADALIERLAAICTGELPQPLTYLVADIGRQHGRLLVGPAASVIRGLDEDLVATVLADRSLRSLQLHRVSSTVLASPADPAAVLGALRSAGYLPMPESPAESAGHSGNAPGFAEGSKATEYDDVPGDSGAAGDAEVISLLLRRGARLARRNGAPAEGSGSRAFAEQLLGTASEKPPKLTPTEAQLAAAKSLSRSELSSLARAVDACERVGIEYLSSGGAVTSRVISSPQLLGESLFAWCELREDDRWFRLDRITAVFPAD